MKNLRHTVVRSNGSAIDPQQALGKVLAAQGHLVIACEAAGVNPPIGFKVRTWAGVQLPVAFTVSREAASADWTTQLALMPGVRETIKNHDLAKFFIIEDLAVQP